MRIGSSGQLIRQTVGGKAEFVGVVTVTNIRPVEVIWCKHNLWSDIIWYDIWPKAKMISLASLMRVGMCAALVGWHGGWVSYQEHQDEGEFHWQKVELLATRIKAIEGEFKEQRSRRECKKKSPLFWNTQKIFADDRTKAQMNNVYFYTPTSLPFNILNWFGMLLCPLL